MHTIHFRDMYNTNYSLRRIWAEDFRWKNCKLHILWQNTPRPSNALLFLKNCNALYTLPTGETIYAKCGSLVYLPINSRYTQYMTNIEDSSADTVSAPMLGFNLCDETGDDFSAMSQISIINFSTSDTYNDIFNKLLEIYTAPDIAHALLKARAFELLHEISKSFRYERIYSKTYLPIVKGILLLEQSASHDMSIAEIAKMCNVSETCFRRLFRQYAGISPSEYKNQYLIRRAKTLLCNSDLNISEISAQLGFEDAAYFSKVFKKNTGITPTEYAHKNGYHL